MELEELIKKKNILVVGDVMLDMYYMGEVNRISPEAPVPVFRKRSEKCVLGGAANVAANLIAAGQNVSIMALIGKDVQGKLLEEKLKEQGIDICLLLETERPTTVKTRFLADNNQQVMRLDVEDITDLSRNDCDYLLQHLHQVISKFDLVVCSDYLKGIMTYEFTQGMIEIANSSGVKVIIDVKDPKYDKYRGAYLIKPNLGELQSLLGEKVSGHEEIARASQLLRKVCQSKYVLTTCGARGMVLVGDDVEFSIEAVGRDVFDVTGAGDTVLSYLAACMVNGVELKKSVEISNCAAGLQVSKVGASPVYLWEVDECLGGTARKIMCERDADNFRKRYQDKKIVFTNGCFDILHVGHTRYLQEAAGLGDILIVGVNSDSSVKRLKGEKRPINPESDRAELLCALGYIDYVVIFEEDTPYQLIQRLQPDVLVKGGDYEPEDVVGRDIVEKRGGKLVIIDFVKGRSTTSMINKAGLKLE